jgi:cytoskeletal protein CcmA (bactofilin family)
MFSKGTAAKAEKDSVPSIISHGTHIVGDITTDGEVQVDGKVEGNVRCRSLIVADTGEVSGKVTCESVTIHGTITGTVCGKSVCLASSARMVGDVNHETLTIEQGAHFKGQCIPVEAKDAKDTKKDSVVALCEARVSLPPPQKPKDLAQA